MDHLNLFETKTTYRLRRLEFGVGLVVSLYLFVAHIGEVRWIPAIILFFYIDVIGYIPGMIANLRSKNGEVGRIYYVLYNTMHSAITQSVAVGLWALVFGFEWALLVIPIHLCGDRALFGNFMKSFVVAFEPEKHPAFAEFERRLAGPWTAASGKTLEGV
ncbi:hypothetical protein [Nocardia pseudobrasiliensis]|uniref:Integral membrane protein n=1 Tax=Nocardia pseudobrasiliensis TaxID=45979 RepID=A0A370IFA8_9NOCA|nr:hypothetical protein [Nocardia pseudobrasiliensis]RDI68144.1 hypothetical protein DFR76_102545 [Nocardia pseudobrasiliensis]